MWSSPIQGGQAAEGRCGTCSPWAAPWKIHRFRQWMPSMTSTAFSPNVRESHQMYSHPRTNQSLIEVIGGHLSHGPQSPFKRRFMSRLKPSHVPMAPRDTQNRIRPARSPGGCPHGMHGTSYPAVAMAWRPQGPQAMSWVERRWEDVVLAGGGRARDSSRSEPPFPGPAISWGDVRRSELFPIMASWERIQSVRPARREMTSFLSPTIGGCGVLRRGPPSLVQMA